MLYFHRIYIYILLLIYIYSLHLVLVCVFECRYDHYRGVVCVVAVKDGSVGLGECATSHHLCILFLS